jgi:hypothetical protein
LKPALTSGAIVIAGGVQAFFLAFLLNVLTDMRWLAAYQVWGLEQAVLALKNPLECDANR